MHDRNEIPLYIALALALTACIWNIRGDLRDIETRQNVETLQQQVQTLQEQVKTLQGE